MAKTHWGECVFCGNSDKLSEEDPLPKWVSRELQRLHPHDYVWAVDIDLNESEIIRHVGKKVGSPSTVKLPVVCEPCNNGWMSDIENATQIFMLASLGGVPIEITSEQQHTLATWGTLKALTYDLKQPNYTPVVSSQDLQLFYAERKPPTQFKMWLGHYSGHTDHLAFVLREATAAVEDYDGFRAGTPHAQILNLVFGDLVVQSIFVGVEGRRVPSAYGRLPVDPSAVRVWPPTAEPIHWPPTVQLTSKGFETFAGMPMEPEALIRLTSPRRPGE